MPNVRTQARKRGGSGAINYFLNMLNRQRRLRDTDVGLLRHYAGGNKEALWDYAPSDPPYPLTRARTFIWTFDALQDSLTDAVSATGYRWNETKDGDGTPLATQDVVGGAAKFTNNAGDNKYYFYELGQEIAQLVSGYDLWFSIVLQVSDATQSEVFAGLCQRSAGNLFDNRVNGVGFRKDDGDTNIDLETVLASSASEVLAQGTLADNTDVKLGFHYVSTVPEVLFFINGTYADRLDTTLPTTEMCVAFGLRNGEGVAKSMTVKTIQLMVEVDK